MRRARPRRGWRPPSAAAIETSKIDGADAITAAIGTQARIDDPEAQHALSQLYEQTAKPLIARIASLAEAAL